MAKIKRKKRRSGQRGQAAPVVAGLEGPAREVLDEALARIMPRPDATNWLPMVRGLARQKGIETYMEGFLKEHADTLSWEWSALWICHTHLAENGLMDETLKMYEVLIEHYPRNYLTELSQGRMFRDYLGEYVVARDHMRFAAALWPDGCEANYQLGILYDLLGMPEFAFNFAERAYDHADQFGESAYKLKARVSFNMAVAMWQAARPYGDIKAYLRRALDDWPEYDRAQKFLDSLPENDDADPKGRNAMQRFTDDVRQQMNQPSYVIVEPEEQPEEDAAE